MLNKVNDILSKNKRESNIELLRILAMIMIVMCHVAAHGILKEIDTSSSFSNFVFYKKLYIVQISQFLGAVSDNIFLLISGYFLINSKINFLKQVKKIIPQMLFVIIALMVVSIIYGKFDTHFNGLITINNFNEEWWFIGYYFIIILIASITLNKFLNKLDKAKYLTFLSILFVIVSLSWSIKLLEGLSENLPILISGIFTYSLGGYIRKYKPFERIKSVFMISILILSFITLYFSYRNYVINNINTSILNGDVSFTQTITYFQVYETLAIIVATILFILFLRLNIVSNKIINYLAGGTFMMYLIHENNFTRSIYLKFNWISLLNNNTYKFILCFILYVIIIYIVGIVFYILYEIFMKLIKSKLVKKLIYKEVGDLND